MSRYRMLIPRFFSPWWETMGYRHRLMEHFLDTKMHPDHFFSPSLFDGKFERQMFKSFFRPWNNCQEMENEWSGLKSDKNKFYVSVNMQQYKPDEVNVKIIDDVVIVEAKHEGKEDEDGTLSRHFVGKYIVPEQCDVDQIASTLSSDGILTITAPKKSKEAEDKKEKVVNIKLTGKPAVEEEETVKQAASEK